MIAAPGAGECVAWGHERSRFPPLVDGAKGVVGGSDRLARGVRSDERASRLAAGRPSR